MKITDTDRGARRMMIKVRGALAMRFTVGIHKDKAAETYPHGATVGQVAAAHEYGLKVPQRSWLRAWFDGHGRAAFRSQIQHALATAIATEGVRQLDTVGALGVKYVEEIQKRMDAHIDPALQPATIARKERTSTTPDTPLEDTHKMRNAVGYEVTLK